MSTEPPHATDPTRIVPAHFVFPGTETLDPREVFAGPGYQAPRRRTDPVAVVALVLAFASVVPGLGLLAALSGWWALRRLEGTYATGRAQAWFGVVVGTAATLLWLWILWMTVFLDAG